MCGVWIARWGYDLKKQNNMKGVGQDYLRVVKIIHDNTNPIADTKEQLISYGNAFLVHDWCVTFAHHKNGHMTKLKHA